MRERIQTRRRQSLLLPRFSPGVPVNCVVMFAALCAILASVGRASALPAQANGTTVRGTIRNGAGLPLEGAQITIAVPSGAPLTATSNERGEFSLTAPVDVPLRVHVRRIGFRPDSALALPQHGKVASVAVTLERVAIDLAPVTVVGRRDVSGSMAGFYNRRSSNSGRFFTREEIERRNAARMSDLLRMVPGLRVQPRGMQNSVRIRGSRCAPFIWLDGTPLSAMEFDLDSSDPSVYEGIEVYSGPASVPVEFQGNRAASSSCGTIILWSKRGENRGSQLAQRDASAAAKVAALAERSAVFLDHQVDVQARLDSTAIERPVYPDAMLDAGMPGHVLAEFVVSATGSVLLETFNVVIASDRTFVEPVRRALKDQRFAPAMRGGKAVQQVVHQPFTFVPDSTARRKR